MAKKKGLRAVSIYRAYDGPTAQDERKMVLQDGQVQVLKKGLVARPWTWGDVTAWENIQTLKHFEATFRGLGMDENPANRLSTFDSLWAQEVNGWNNEERELVEERVRSGPGNGVDYIVIDSPLAPAPWPSYDKLKPQGKRTLELVVEKIADITRDLGIDPAHVLAYERENENRKAVIAAIEALNAETPAEELIQA